jgi:hypothetical protein
MPRRCSLFRIQPGRTMRRFTWCRIEPKRMVRRSTLTKARRATLTYLESGNFERYDTGNHSSQRVAQFCWWVVNSRNWAENCHLHLKSAWIDMTGKSSLCVRNSLGAGQSGVWISTAARHFYLLPNVETVSGAHQPYSVKWLPGFFPPD